MTHSSVSEEPKHRQCRAGNEPRCGIQTTLDDEEVDDSNRDHHYREPLSYP